MQANVAKGAMKPHFLLHATYWENVVSILREGIVPAKNPLSDTRRPFKDLLQGAEAHVYTVSVGGEKDLQTSGCAHAADFQRQASKASSVGEEAEATRKVDKDLVGMDRDPDAFFLIDTQKAEELGVQLEMVHSVDAEETILIHGKVPKEALTMVEPNDPVALPDGLKAKIVDPRSFFEIPIIDLQQDQAKVVEQLKYACEDVGFMQITGHGISQTLIDTHMRLQKEFFALPQKTKERIALRDSNPVRGYFGKGGEDLDQVLADKVDSADGQKIAQQSRKDKKEGFDTNGVPWAKPVGGYVANIFGSQSQFPDEKELPRFRQTLEEYSCEMFTLSKRLMSLMALVLGKPADFFEPYLTQPVATHRLLHYWPIQDFDTEIGVGEHTDYGFLTILLQDSVGGLQVLNARDGKWVHCCPVPGAFVVNIGDMLGRWTAHRFKSTVHRVVNVSAQDRYSVPYFLEPNMDTLIALGGICTGPASPCDGASAEEETAEVILERFYRASGQLKFDELSKSVAEPTLISEGDGSPLTLVQDMSDEGNSWPPLDAARAPASKRLAGKGGKGSRRVAATGD